MTQLGIKWSFSFPPHPTCASALRGKNNRQNMRLKPAKNYKISSFRLCGH